ncbi:DUF1878 family protein [Bacillus sp. FJAT-47783]|uniref:DUF1878 family protein n=1 Tax=Bacillus sp. FJAT-47783 TaxID=2922712 RepID=UPI001FAE6ED0|nr:DUF1878 family protein [Bacillus sp. FJAT-47783]
MNEFEIRLEKLEYHMQLLLKIANKQKYPFDFLVVQNGLSRNEVDEIMSLCTELEQKHKEQKAQGLLYYTDILTLFVGQLNEKLEVNETIDAMLNQGLFIDLMKDFKRLLSHL